jgi:hypothetical protein
MFYILYSKKIIVALMEGIRKFSYFMNYASKIYHAPLILSNTCMCKCKLLINQLFFNNPQSNIMKTLIKNFQIGE